VARKRGRVMLKEGSERPSPWTDCPSFLTHRIGIGGRVVDRVVVTSRINAPPAPSNVNSTSNI
jgi:hypothetical protein